MNKQNVLVFSCLTLWVCIHSYVHSFIHSFIHCFDLNHLALSSITSHLFLPLSHLTSQKFIISSLLKSFGSLGTLHFIATNLDYVRLFEMKTKGV